MAGSLLQGVSGAPGMTRYFFLRLAGFFFVTCGSGGVASIRRSTSSKAGCGVSRCERLSAMAGV